METSKGKKRKNIAVYLPQIYSSYFSELRNSIEEVAKERGYRLVIFTCFGDESSIDSRAATNVRMTRVSEAYSVSPTRMGQTVC